MQKIIKTLIIVFTISLITSCGNNKNSEKVDDLIKTDQQKADSMKKVLGID